MISAGSEPNLTAEVRQQINRICGVFQEAWKSSQAPQIEDYLEGVDRENRRTLFYELLRTEIELRAETDDSVAPQPYLQRFPDLRSVVESVFSDHTRTTALDQPHVDGTPLPEFPPGHRFGDYSVIRKIGQGSFGVVYLARDLNLDRNVAVKVARPKIFSSSNDFSRFRKEAQNAARIVHPGVAAIYCVACDHEPPFIVQEYVEGKDLKSILAAEPFSALRAVELVAQLAEIIAFAHQEGIYHRDLKPGNILVTLEGRPRIVDFGLALDESERRQHRGERCGTPQYMSPEQVRGESHRLDGRSDIWSLGIILYQMLVGQPPFAGATREELYEEILHKDVRPPRQLKPQLPAELERICLKSLSKRMSDRYSTAVDLAADLGDLLANWNSPGDSTHRAAGPLPSDISPLRTEDDQGPQPKIVPKGLRSFNEHDAEFFLELVPGPRDRFGIPESIRFWKTRIEETENAATFPVGLVYGPSGCGKSSLIRAGLLPRLSSDVIVLYVEAGQDENAATSLLKQLYRHIPGLSPGLDLPGALAELRTGAAFDGRRKLLLVLDQFEQWLHGNIHVDDSVLVHALRQCDGGRIQCLILVRDDFWLAISRFMRALEVGIVEGKNSALVDLFDADHAKLVLGAFGRAYGKLPADQNAITPKQQAFLTEAVAALAEDGKINCVRLALFAEMMKSEPWTPSNLRKVGGVEGVGVAFLDDRFVANTATPACRLHQQAVRAVLNRLLPESGTNIRGQRRSFAELMQASGYVRELDFDELLQILDSETRLITPCDRAGATLDQLAQASTTSDEKFYQLTHDYLVPSIRKWLTRKKRETRRGRAELLLETLTADWNARVDHRRLPTAFEWITVRTLTRQYEWNSAQKSMMAAADRWHISRIGASVVLVACLALGSLGLWQYIEFQQRQAHLRDLVSRLLTAKVNHISQIVSELEQASAENPSAVDWVREAESSPKQTAEGRFNAQLFLAAGDPSVHEPLLKRMLGASPDEHEVIRMRLASSTNDLKAKLLRALKDESVGREAQLRAACALAAMDATNSVWEEKGEQIALALSRCEQREQVTEWIERLMPVRSHLIPWLAKRLRGAHGAASERLIIVSALVRFLRSEPSQLAELALESTADSFPIVLAGLEHNGDGSLAALRELAVKRAASNSPEEQAAFEQKRANAAIALLRLGAVDDFWSLLAKELDSDFRTAVIDRCASFGVDPATLLARLDLEVDPSSRTTILLCLSEYLVQEGSHDLRGALRDKCRSLFERDPASGVHFAAEWILKRLGDSPSLSSSEMLENKAEASRKQWIVTPQGITMVVIRAPQDFVMGSPATETERESEDLEAEHSVHLDYSFAIGSHEITVEQFRRFVPTLQHSLAVTTSPDCPMSNVSWFDAAKFCRRLSEAEGISESDMVYPKVEEIVEGMTLRPDWVNRTGYRLPSEEEWECACRAGTQTARFYGRLPSRLGAYGRYIANSNEKLWPVGSLRPNPWGLFDCYGNVLEWCHDPREISTIDTTPTPPTPATRVMMRSGYYRSVERENRSAKRFLYRPPSHLAFQGLRVTRTIPD